MKSFALVLYVGIDGIFESIFCMIVLGVLCEMMSVVEEQEHNEIISWEINSIKDSQFEKAKLKYFPDENTGGHA